MLGVLFALGSALSSGTETILRRHVLIKEDSLCYTFLFGLLAGLVLLPAFFINYQPPTEDWAWALVVISGTLWSLFGLLLFKAYTYLEASIASPLSRIKLLFVLAMSVIFLKEAITIEKIVGTLLIFAGVIAISYKKEKKLKVLKEEGVILIILGAFVISVVLLVDKYAMSFFNAATFSAPVYFMTPIWLAYFAYRRKEHLKAIIDRNLGATFLTAVFSAGYFYLILNAFKHADASIVVPIVELSVLFSVIGGIIFLKERTDIPKKIFAAIILIIGATILALA